MTRKLLPYEHDLIAALGVSKDEYLEFLALQKSYADVKQDSVLDIRNDPLTTSIVLTVVGVLFQVAAALLTPRPALQETAAQGDTQTREQRFAPRFGFNSVQELAKYGDPIPLVYTDTFINSQGGVRIAASMIWSAVRSYGQNQYLQMLMLLSGGGITAIAADKSAFGQTPVSDLIAQNKWIYFRATSTGALRFSDETSGNSGTDPIRYGNSSDNPYRLQLDASSNRYDGFSQVYSPASSNTFGGYSSVPFAVYWYLRDSKGDKYGEPLDVYLNSSGFTYAANGFSRPLGASTVLGSIPRGASVQVWVRDTIEPTNVSGFNLEFYRAKADARRTIASQFDDAGIFKLGSARFRVTSTQGASTDEGNFFANLTCIEPGNAPSIPYNQETKPTVAGPDVISPYPDFPKNPNPTILCANAETSKLYRGQILYSANGWYRLEMQTDGNLVIYNKAEVAVWNTGTFGSQAAYAYFQADGNLVLYSATGSGVVPSPNLPTTPGPTIPATNTNSSKLFKGQTIYSSNGWYRLTMQNDGNLVIYNKAGDAVWSTLTGGTAAHYAYFQADGNLVLYDNTGVNGTGNVIWKSNNGQYSGVGASYWRLETNGELRLYNTSNVMLYRTHIGNTVEPGVGVGSVVWFSNRGNYPQWQGVRWRLENTGELVLYNSAGSSLWRSHTGTTQEPVQIINTSIARTGYYYLKAMARVEIASYSSLSRCNVLDFALKCSVFRRITGRQREYGSERRAGYPANENGLHQRSSMFLVRYRVDQGNWSYVGGIFVVRRAAEQENYVYLKFISSVPYNWEVEFEPVVDPVSEISKNPELRVAGGLTNYLYLENTGPTFTTSISQTVQISFTGYSKQVSASNQLPPVNKSPTETNEWDWFSLDGDTQYTLSFDRGPEFAITAVTEQQQETFNLARLYRNLTLLGFNVFSGKGLQDMRSFTAFVTQGKPVRRLNTTTLSYPASPDGPSCFAPDVFLDTILDKEDGIGNYANIQGVDTRQLAITKRFCQRNNLFFDGIIADRTNWRSYWAETAPASLLEFARIGGRETLVPSVPYNPDTGEITRTVAITALFNQGNILADSYKEEFIDYDSNVQDIIATVIYRSLERNGVFAVNRSITIQRADTSEANAVLQTFDLSSSVTTEAQAILFGKLICNLRRYVRSSIEFKTFPTTSPISPGAYIFVDIGQNQWDNIYTGTVGPGGVLNTPVAGQVPNGTYNILLYRSGNDVVSTTAAISNNTAPSLSDRDGWLFVLGQTVRSKRVFRVSEVSMDEEGEVTVRATAYPCDASDRSLIADFTDSLFTIRR